jgi:hypothetical protein
VGPSGGHRALGGGRSRLRATKPSEQLTNTAGASSPIGTLVSEISRAISSAVLCRCRRSTVGWKASCRSERVNYSAGSGRIRQLRDAEGLILDRASSAADIDLRTCNDRSRPEECHHRNAGEGCRRAWDQARALSSPRPPKGRETASVVLQFRRRASPGVPNSNSPSLTADGCPPVPITQFGRRWDLPAAGKGSPHVRVRPSHAVGSPSDGRGRLAAPSIPALHPPRRMQSCRR